MFLVLLLFVSYLYFSQSVYYWRYIINWPSFNIIWISFVVDEIIFNMKLESILLEVLSKADVSNLRSFFKKIIHVYW